jgi:hypothetical protein
VGRPKGSKNKPKEATPESAVVSKEVFDEPTPEPGWEPKPNMGDIKPPKAEEFPCGCGHPKAMHYGPKTDWCNTRNCTCQRFN